MADEKKEIKPIYVKDKYGRVTKILPTKEETKPTTKGPRAPATSVFIADAEEESGTTINSITTIITEQDVSGLTPRPNVNVPVTTATINYTVKKIPVPSTNNINVLSASSKIWNKPRVFENATSGELSYSISEDNCIGSGGRSINIKVLGDNDAAFKIVVKDVTNSKWYNWEEEEFQSGYNDLESTADSGSLLLNFPSQEAETTYNTFFANIGSTTYDISLPTEDNPWVTNQLVNPTITFRFDNDKGFAYKNITTKTHAPGDTLDSGSINDGKIPITITTIALRGGMSLKNSTVSTENINVANDDVVIKSADLIASVSGSVGTITGTITIGKSSKRDGDILFQPFDFFTIT